MNKKHKAIYMMALLESARHASWITYNNALFNAVDGIVSTAFPDKAGRQEYLRSEWHARIKAIIDHMRT